jgi:hypothetical protein
MNMKNKPSHESIFLCHHASRYHPEKQSRTLLTAPSSTWYIRTAMSERQCFTAKAVRPLHAPSQPKGQTEATNS